MNSNPKYVRYSYLENTSGNHNKFYEMFQRPKSKMVDSDAFVARFGRIGKEGSRTLYRIEQWDDVYSKKTANGYVDKTSTQSYEIVRDLWIVEKFEKLYWRLHNHPNKNVDNDEWQDDFKWAREILDDVKSGVVLRKIDLYSANQIWNRYDISKIG
tara:strand:- start:662 stop:1129 length:468 start_codon:yes stop_codon:yes gene_type:complete